MEERVNEGAPVIKETAETSAVGTSSEAEAVLAEDSAAAEDSASAEELVVAEEETAPEEKLPLAVSLYVPFCREKCGYCDALVCAGANSKTMQAYVNALGKEIASLAPDLSDYEVCSIYITGGSPNLLGGRLLRDLIACVRSNFNVSEDCETTIACSPINVSVSMLENLSKSQLSRFELELETTDALQHLSLNQKFLLGSTQDSALVITQSRCKNFDVSLLYGMQGQSNPSVESSIDTSARMGASHITFAPLRLSEGTTVKEAYEKQQISIPTSPRNVYPDEAKRLQLYTTGVHKLEERGYVRYTQRHFAKPGFECQRILDQCRGIESIGFGLGASSRYGGVACQNTSDLDTYIAHSSDFTKIMVSASAVDEVGAARRQLAEGLLLLEGTSRGGIEAMAGASLEEIAPELAGFKESGWLEEDEQSGAVRLTFEGGHHYEEVRDALIA